METKEMKAFKLSTLGLLINIMGLLFIICFSHPVFLVNDTISGLITAFSILAIMTALPIFGHVGGFIARGKPATSIEVGQKYQVLSVVTLDEQKSEKWENVCLLLQKDNEVIFYQKNKNETIITPEIGDTIILTKTGELVIIRKE